MRGLVESQMYLQARLKARWASDVPFAFSLSIISPIKKVVNETHNLLNGRLIKPLPEEGVEEIRVLIREINSIASLLARSREELKLNE